MRTQRTESYRVTDDLGFASVVCGNLGEAVGKAASRLADQPAAHQVTVSVAGCVKAIVSRVDAVAFNIAVA